MPKGKGYGTYNSRGDSSKGAKVNRGKAGSMSPNPKAVGTYSSKGSQSGGKVNRGS